jgi:hypothetical protein
MTTNSDLFDRIGDALSGIHVPTPLPPVTAARFVWDEEDSESGRFEFEAGVDKALVDFQIRKFHSDLMERFAQANVPADDVRYVVLRDGRWHVDDTQALLMLHGKPHLTPREWLDRMVEILKRTR